MEWTEVKVHTSSKEPEKVLLPINCVCSNKAAPLHFSDKVLTFQGCVLMSVSVFFVGFLI